MENCYHLAKELELLQEEFTDYQLLMHGAIPSDVWKKAAVTDEEEHTIRHRMDVVWHHLSSLKAPDGNLRFSRLCNIAKCSCSSSSSFQRTERTNFSPWSGKTRPRLGPIWIQRVLYRAS